MHLGEKLLRARQEAGLSQRQLCEGIVTRNMLSQIEHGSARPSMDTLRALAQRLGKPLSWFWEEAATPNAVAMEQARLAWQAGNYPGIQGALDAYRGPDPLLDQEKALLTRLALVGLARRALDAGMAPYARQLLEQAGEAPCIYATGALERERQLLLAQAEPRLREALLDALPGPDEELLLRAGLALDRGDSGRCAACLEAMENREAPQWQLLRGRACMAAGEYARAAEHLHQAEAALPRQTAPLLERCYRELEDYKMAYFYACKHR